MQPNKVFLWLVQSERRKEILKAFNQPLTAKQLSRRTGIGIDSCSFLLWQFGLYDLVYCLNPEARSNRLHWITNLGNTCQRKLRQSHGLSSLIHHFPNVNWELYGSVCYIHRSSVIKALVEPMQPAEINRRARSQNPDIRMSANNVRDVIRIFLDDGIVRPVWFQKKAHPNYELTEEATTFRELLLGADVMP